MVRTEECDDWNSIYLVKLVKIPIIIIIIIIIIITWYL